MTKRVAVREEQQRAGVGGRPVSVDGQGRSLLSSQDEEKGVYPAIVVPDGIPPL